MALVTRSQALFFQMKGGAGQECFRNTPGKGHRILGSYEADGPTEGVVVTVLGPAKEELWRGADSSGKFSIDIVTEGVHQLCFLSTVAEAQVISFNFRIDEHPGAESSSHHGKEFVTKVHTDKVGELVEKLEM